LRFLGAGSCLPGDHAARSVATVDDDLANRELHLRSVGDVAGRPWRIPLLRTASGLLLVSGG